MCSLMERELELVAAGVCNVVGAMGVALNIASNAPGILGLSYDSKPPTKVRKNEAVSRFS